MEFMVLVRITLQCRTLWASKGYPVARSNLSLGIDDTRSVSRPCIHLPSDWQAGTIRFLVRRLPNSQLKFDCTLWQSLPRVFFLCTLYPPEACVDVSLGSTFSSSALSRDCISSSFWVSRPQNGHQVTLVRRLAYDVGNRHQ